MLSQIKRLKPLKVSYICHGKVPKVVIGLLDFVEDVFVGVKSSDHLLFRCYKFPKWFGILTGQISYKFPKWLQKVVGSYQSCVRINRNLHCAIGTS